MFGFTATRYFRRQPLKSALGITRLFALCYAAEWPTSKCRISCRLPAQSHSACGFPDSLTTRPLTDVVQLLEGRVNRPRKSLHPFPLVIHDCWLAARSLASVRPTVRLARGLAPESGSLIFARTLSFLSAAAFESRTSRGPNSLSLRLFFIGVPCD